MKPGAFASTVCLRSAGELRVVRLGCAGPSIAFLEVFSSPPGSFVSQPIPAVQPVHSQICSSVLQLKRRVMKKALLLALCLLLTAPLVLAQARPTGGVQGNQVQPYGYTHCGSGDAILPTDGSRVSDTIGASSSNFYFVRLKAGHSYAAEVWDAIDTSNTVTASLYLWSYNNSCGATLPVTNVVSIDPDLSQMYAARISWIQSADALEVLEMRSAASAARSYEIRIVDTTLYSPRWSTWSGFITQWGFYNVTNSSISGVFTVFDTTGAAIKIVNVTVSAGKVRFYSSIPADLNLPNSTSGSVMFAYVGPAGAFQADSMILNTPAGAYVTIKFEPRNYQH